MFRAFSDIYDKFRERFPNHPLGEEIRRALSKGRFPDDKWLKAQIKAMKHLMMPLWRKTG